MGFKNRIYILKCKKFNFITIGIFNFASIFKHSYITYNWDSIGGEA